MRHHPGSFHEQATLLRRQFLQDGGLPFTDVLTDEVLTQALAAVGGWLDRVFSPLVTLWVFLGQVLSPDHSCRAAVARLVAHRVARGPRPCSARTGVYGRARKRLPEAFFSGVACSVGRALDARAEPGWRWKGRRVYRDLLAAIATHRVADRPDRLEPRLKKRRWNHYDWLTRPRAEMKCMMAKRVIEKQVPFVRHTAAQSTGPEERRVRNCSLNHPPVNGCELPQNQSHRRESISTTHSTPTGSVNLSGRISRDSRAKREL